MPAISFPVTVQSNSPSVERCGDRSAQGLQALFTRYGLEICWVEDHASIPGSHFGEPEAGLIENRLYLRADTPVHSALHESCHYICMPANRRENLHTDAGGDYDEENAVCYLSILLADYIEAFDQQAMMQDMDSWGYTFRLGSASEWFYKDATDARNWLLSRQIINTNNQPQWRLNQRHE